MKSFFTFSLLLSGTVLFCSGTSAQNKYTPSFYRGDWDFEVKDIPDTEVSGTLNFSPEGNSLSSYFINGKNGDTVHVEKVNLADTSITLFFNAMGRNIVLTLSPKDNQHIAGTVMDAYTLWAERRKE